MACLELISVPDLFQWLGWSHFLSLSLYLNHISRGHIRQFRRQFGFYSSSNQVEIWRTSEFPEMKSWVDLHDPQSHCAYEDILISAV